MSQADQQAISLISITSVLFAALAEVAPEQPRFTAAALYAKEMADAALTLWPISGSEKKTISKVLAQADAL